MFVALEGADGTGKSTLCVILAKKLGAIHYLTPPKQYLARREYVDKNSSTEEHYRFYRDGIYDASREIQEALARGQKVVSDRYWLSTYTYHQVMGMQVSVDDFRSVVMPTVTIILSLSKEVQKKRLTQRGLSFEDQKMIERQQELAVAFYRNVLEFGIPFLMIDTQRFTPDACADIVLQSLSS